MPETEFSLRRLGLHLRKWIGLYLAATLALCFLNHLIFTVTRPRISDDALLKVMLLNVEPRLSDEAYAQLTMALLPEIQTAAPKIEALDFEQLRPAAAGDEQGMMLLNVKLISGYGDLFLTDAQGLALLAERQALADLEGIGIEGWEPLFFTDESGQRYAGGLRTSNCSLTGGEACLAIFVNGTDPDSARVALPILADALKE